MVTTTNKLVLVLLLLVLAAVPALAETISCAQCGMTVDLGSKFTSRIVQGGKTFYFCDIGDLLTYLSKHQQQAGQIEVRDYPTGDWIPAKTASYVSAPNTFKSPMGWGIAGFKDQRTAAMNGKALDFDAALKAVK